MRTGVHLAGRVVLLVLAGASLTGCGDGTSSGSPSRPSSAPAAELPRAGSPPVGTQRFSCRVDSEHGRVTMALDLPRGFRSGKPEDYIAPGPGGFCVWEHEVTAKDESGPYRETVVVTMTGGNSRRELQKQYDDAKPDLVEHGDTQTDDSVLSLTLRHDVPTYGGIHGDRLAEWCYCDGQNTISRAALADGVQLGYSSVHSLTDETDREFQAMLDTAGSLSRAGTRSHD